MAQRLSIIVFPGGANLPLWTGIRQGFFAQLDLDVQPSYTRNSVEQISGLVKGTWDIGLTGFDNIVAYQEGQGEASLDREPDLFAFMGSDNAFLRLVVQPDIKSYANLKGRALSVDAMTTGFAFVLRKMLALNGLSEGDVTFERAGGALQRYDALKEGRHAGTLLLTPFELTGRSFGLHVLQSASDVLPHYQGVVGVASRAWAKDNADRLDRFIAGYLVALRWLYQKDNAQAACAILMENVPHMTAELAAATCGLLLAENGGFDPAARLDSDGMKIVLALRSEYGRPQKILGDYQKYVDLGYYYRAVARI
ncbi:MAG: ABC transporter substrate-binding protein [Rhizobiales bacterium]|nr:ABC transporter substrate-binding protein [Hyphomicrobiales bacterium]